MDAQQHDSWLALNLVPGLGPTLLGRCLRAFGSAQQILAASTAQLSAVEGIGAKRSGELRRQIDQLNNEGALEREKQLIEQFNVSLYCIDDETYPKLLRHIHDPPPLLYVRGQLLAQDAVALAIVGARRPDQIAQTALAGERVIRAEHLAAIDALLAARDAANGD